MSRFDVMSHSATRSKWRTPQDLFARLHASHAFTVDVAADAQNAMLARHWTKEIDGLAQPWTGERVWCNPPYGRSLIEPWVAKASRLDADLAVFLLPVRTSARWWWKYVAPFAHIRYFPFRVHFEGGRDAAPFDSCLAIYYPNLVKRGDAVPMDEA